MTTMNINEYYILFVFTAACIYRTDFQFTIQCSIGRSFYSLPPEDSIFYDL